jgi:poly [ADP-ribose] polymerase 10/14/15
MYYAKVLVGAYTLGAHTMLVPPIKDPVNNPNESFDSVVDRMNNPGIYVLFKDYEYYTEYLITFR